MANLPTRTTANTAAEHVGDHNNLHAFHNLIDAAGDLIVGTGVDTAGRLAKGAALQGLRVNAAGTALEYGADAASSVVFTPAAGIAATNVQAAIEEVVSDSSAAYQAKADTFQIVALMPQTAHIAFDGVAKETAAFLTNIRFSGGALDNQVIFPVPQMKGGTWSLVLTHMKNTDAGIYYIASSPDGSTYTELGTIDGYSATYVAARSTLTGVTIPADTTRIRVRMGAKNASSSNYTGRFDYLAGVRTGA